MECAEYDAAVAHRAIVNRQCVFTNARPIDDGFQYKCWAYDMTSLHLFLIDSS